MAEKPSEYLTPDLRAFEAALASLVPRPAALDRDRLMYEAGRAAVALPQVQSRGRWAWPAAFSAMSAVAASLLLVLALRPPALVERAAQSTATATVAEPDERGEPTRTAGVGSIARAGGATTAHKDETPAHQATPEPSYLDLRDRVLALGIDTWQAPAHVARAESPQPTYHELLIELAEIH